MSLKSFRVEGQKGLKLADCSAVPPIMIICGPNGGGKSTLLYSLHTRTGSVELDEGSTLLYQPPHRVVRRQAVPRKFLGEVLSRFGDILSGTSVAGFEGLQIPYPARTPDNVDESGSTLKFVLGKLVS